MPIYITEQITINGSQNFLGGQVYTLNYNQGFNGSPSTVEAGIVAANADYQRPILSFKTPYLINVGGSIERVNPVVPPEHKLKMYAYRYCIEDGQNGRIMTVYFQDNINKFRRYWVAPFGEVCYSANVIILGSPITDSSGGNPNQKIISYNYGDFAAATQFLKIPNIQYNEYTRLNAQGTVLEIFNRFMDIYGFSWYMDEDENIKLIDIKKPIDITSSINQLEKHVRKLSSTICEDISNNFARGVVALDDITDDDADLKILNEAIPIWNGQEDSYPRFLGYPLDSTYGAKAALYAAQGPAIYFSYIWSTFSLEAAMSALGLNVTAQTTLDKIEGLFENQTNGENAPYTPGQAKDVIVFTVSEDQADENTPYNKDKKLGEFLTKGIYTVRDINPSIQWSSGGQSLLNPRTQLFELQDFGGLLPYNTSLKEIETRNIWLLEYPQKLDATVPNILDSALGPINPPPAKSVFSKALIEEINKRFPQKFNLGTDANPKNIKSSYVKVDRNGLSGPNPPPLPNIPYPFGAVRQIVGVPSSPDDIRFQLPSYGLNGRKISRCDVPDITQDADISSIEVKTFENLTTKLQNPDELINQNVFKRKQTDKTYSAEVRGITTQTNPDDKKLTPSDGLDSFNIRLDGSNGYSTSYSLSNKRSVPRESEETFQPRQKSTIN